MELRGLITWEFGESDLRSIRDHASLQRLTIKDAPRLTCLSGINDLPDLLQLCIQAAPRLEDIDDLGGVAGSLEELWLEGCRSLRSVEPVEALTKLRVLNISDCGSIETLARLSPASGVLHQRRQPHPRIFRRTAVPRTSALAARHPDLPGSSAERARNRAAELAIVRPAHRRNSSRFQSVARIV